jgi:disulfide oxidoreductase YuzD
MRSRSNMQACAQGIEAMGNEEAAYWLGMAMHRKYPRRVLMALRFLLIDPKNG